MNKNVTAFPNWAQEILDTLKCEEVDILTFKVYRGINPVHIFALSEEVSEEGKPIYVVSYSRRDCLKRTDEDKNAIAKCLTPLLGEPIASYEGENCDFLEFKRKVN